MNNNLTVLKTITARSFSTGFYYSVDQLFNPSTNDILYRVKIIDSTILTGNQFFTQFKTTF